MWKGGKNRSSAPEWGPSSGPLQSSAAELWEGRDPGSARIVTLKHVYVLLWTVLLYVALRARMTGIFTANNWYGFPVKGDGFGDDPDDD